MAESKKIQGKDLIAPNFLRDSIEQAEKFLTVIKETKKIIVETNKVTSKALKGSKGSSSSDLKKQNDLMAESAKQRQAMAKAEAAELKAVLDLEKAKKSLADFEKKKIAIAEKEKKAIEQQNSAYAQASKRLNDLRKEYKDLVVSGKGADETTKKLLKTIQDLDKELKKVDADVGQFNREVGNYKNSVKEALAETNLFTAGLSKLGDEQTQIIQGLAQMSGQLKKVKEGQDAAAKSASNFNKILKASGIGLIITAVAALFAFFTGSREGEMEFEMMLNNIKATLDALFGTLQKIGKGLAQFGKGLALVFKGEFSQASKAFSEGMDSIGSAFDDTVEKIDTQIDAYNRLTKKIYEYEDAIIRLQIQLERAKMDEEDANEILNDQTIALNKQEKALRDGIAARLLQAKINKDIADKEAEIAMDQLEIKLRKNNVSEAEIKLIRMFGLETFLNGNLTMKVHSQDLQNIKEKVLAQENANDALEDLARQEAERERKMKQDKIINGIELIRSKKLGADEEVKILTKQVNDEKFQLEERQKFQEDLRKAQLEARAEEIRLLTEFGISEAEILDLIAEKDQVALARKLENLRATKLSQAATDELAKVVFEAQTQELEYQEQLAKFEEERIKREEKIAALQREITIINEQSVLNDVQRMEQERQRIVEESNQQILQQNNVFNKQLLAQRKDAAEEAFIIMEEEFKIRRDLAQRQFDSERINIEQSVNDEKIREKEIEKLQATFNSEMNKLRQEEKDRIEALEQKELEQLRMIEIRKTEVIVENLQKATQALSEELDKRQNMELNRLSRSIDKTTQMVDKQRDLATRGLANTLAFQEAELEKQLLRQQDLEKQQQKEKERIALAEALLNAYNAELKQPNSNPTTAAAKALADVLLFKGLAAGLVQFAAEGNDDVQGPGTTTSDSIPFMLSKHEGVVKASANMDNPGVVASLNNDTFDQLYMPRYDLSKDINQGMGYNMYDSLLLQTNKEIIEILEEIRNKPVQLLDVDKFGNIIETVYENGRKTVTKYKNRRSIG
jgi:hypothetical protein